MKQDELSSSGGRLGGGYVGHLHSNFAFIPFNFALIYKSTCGPFVDLSLSTPIYKK
jgi:hypothetical protein